MVSSRGRVDHRFLTLNVQLTGTLLTVSWRFPRHTRQQLPGSANADAADLLHCARVVARFAQHQSPAHPERTLRECLRAEQAPRASQSPPHDFGLPVERWQTYARGFTRCKRHQKSLASCPPHPAKSRREWLLGCRTVTTPDARPTTPPAGKSTGRPTRGATCGASATQKKDSGWAREVYGLLSNRHAS
jgi:hypothetical protein